MDFKKIIDAEKLKLVRHSHWLQNTTENRKYIKDTQDQIMLDPSRRAMLIKNEDTGKIAIYVDNRAKQETQGPRTRRVSKSGKFRSIRHLAETLFSKNPDLPLVTFRLRMQEEYPDTAPAGDKAYGHWCWYRFHLVINSDYKCIPKPSRIDQNGKFKNSVNRK